MISKFTVEITLPITMTVHASSDDEARENALSNVNDLYVLDMLQDKTRMAFKRIVSLSYPDYRTDISIAEVSAAQGQGQLPPTRDAD